MRHGSSILMFLARPAAYTNVTALRTHVKFSVKICGLSAQRDIFDHALPFQHSSSSSSTDSWSKHSVIASQESIHGDLELTDAAEARTTAHAGRAGAKGSLHKQQQWPQQHGKHGHRVAGAERNQPQPSTNQPSGITTDAPKPAAADGSKQRQGSKHVSQTRTSYTARSKDSKRAGSRDAKAPASATEAAATTPASTQSSTEKRSRGSTDRSSKRDTSTAGRFDIGSRHPFTDVRLKSFRQLQHLVAAHGRSARIADITAMMSRLKTVDDSSAADKVLLLDQLWQLLLPQLPHAAARHCAEVMLTASKLGHAPQGLFEACLQQFVRQVAQAEARILSNAIYALATAPEDSIRAAGQQQLQDVLLPAFLAQVPHGNSQSVANVAYGLAVMGHNDRASQQLQQLLQAAQPSIWATGSSQEVSNVLWAVGMLAVQPPEQHRAALLDRIVAAADISTAQDISNCMYGLALLQQPPTRKQHQQLATALLRKPCDGQAIGNFLWCTAKLALQLETQQIEAFLSKLLQCGQGLRPHTISIALWSVATMECSLPNSTILQLLQQLAASPVADPQALGISLWAAVKLKAELPTPLLHRLYQQLAAVVDAAEPQAVSNAFWAAAMMQPQPYLPRALLGLKQQQQLPTTQRTEQKQRGSGRQQPKQPKQQQRQEAGQGSSVAVIISKVARMKPVELSNLALALGILHVKQMDIMAAIIDAAVQHVQANTTAPSHTSSSNGSVEGVVTPVPSTSSSISSSSSSSRVTDLDPSTATISSSTGNSSPYVMGPQALCNICWACAILDLRQHEQQLMLLAQACAACWPVGQYSMPVEEGTQLYQLHLWLTEQVGTQGLAGCLTPQQLQQCRDCMEYVVATRTQSSLAQLQVLEAAQQLSCLQEVQLEAVTADGLLSVDVAAVVTLPSSVAAAAAAEQQDGAAAAAANAAAGAGLELGLSTGTASSTSTDSAESAEGSVSSLAASEGIAAKPQHSSNSSTSAGFSNSSQAELLPAAEQHPDAPYKQLLAIEFDGPYHFCRPGKQPTGPTAFRNKLLAARGYVVLSIPYWEWQGLPQTQRGAYLQDGVIRACSQHSDMHSLMWAKQG